MSLSYMALKNSIHAGDEEPDQPSWVWWLVGFNPEAMCPGQSLELLEPFREIRPVKFSGSTLIAWRILFDAVDSAYDNVSPENFVKTILYFYYNAKLPARIASNIPSC